jgi:hypothetical protein
VRKHYTVPKIVLAAKLYLNINIKIQFWPQNRNMGQCPIFLFWQGALYALAPVFSRKIEIWDNVPYFYFGRDCIGSVRGRGKSPKRSQSPVGSTRGISKSPVRVRTTRAGAPPTQRELRQRRNL